MIDLLDLIQYILLIKAKDLGESNVVIAYYFILFLLIFIMASYELFKSYRFFQHTTELKQIFKPLLIILGSFTIVSFINSIDIIIYYSSNRSMNFRFLIPFFPVVLVLFGSKGIINQIIHRSKKIKRTFKILIIFSDLTLVVYLLETLIIIYGAFFSNNVDLPLLLAIIGFLINEILFVFIIFLIQRQRSEISSTFNKVRLLNVQVGYIGIIIYFLALTVIYLSTSGLISFVFTNIKAASSLVIIIGYYWSIVIPKWQEKWD